jgi:DNA-binding NtrC family response regulator
MGPNDLTLDAAMKAHAMSILRLCRGRHDEAARVLGIDRKTLRLNLRRWKMEQAKTDAAKPPYIVLIDRPQMGQNTP